MTGCFSTMSNPVLTTPNGDELSFCVFQSGTLASGFGTGGEFEATIEQAEEQLGLSNPNLLGSLNNLALLYSSAKQLAKAAPLLERMVTITEEGFLNNPYRSVRFLDSGGCRYDLCDFTRRDILTLPPKSVSDPIHEVEEAVRVETK